MRLIDADVLWEWLDNEPWFDNADRDEIAFPIVNAIPTVDAEVVVRCKDCLYSRERYGHIECIHGVSYRNTWNKPDFYCAYGERKDGDGNG